MNEATQPFKLPAGLVITLIGAILFSTKAILVKTAFASGTVKPLTLLALRMIFSLPFYLIMAWVARDKKGQPAVSGQQWLYVVLLGLSGYYLSSFLDFEGLQYISAGLERLILFLYPGFVVMLNLFLFKQPVSGMQVFALVLTYAGIMLAYLGELRLDTANPYFYTGCMLILTCAATYAVYIAGSGRLVPLVGATRFTAYAMLAATAGVLVHFVVGGNVTELVEQKDWWLYGLLLALVATVVPSLLIAYGLKMIGANNVAIVSSIGPVSTILQAHYFLGEPVYGQQLAGTLLVMAGVLLTGWKGKK